MVVHAQRSRAGSCVFWGCFNTASHRFPVGCRKPIDLPSSHLRTLDGHRREVQLAVKEVSSLLRKVQLEDMERRHTEEMERRRHSEEPPLLTSLSLHSSQLPPQAQPHAQPHAVDEADLEALLTSLLSTLSLAPTNTEAVAGAA